LLTDLHTTAARHQNGNVSIVKHDSDW